MTAAACPLCGGDGAVSLLEVWTDHRFLLETCCEGLHDGVREAATAGELMRARYTAYAVGRPDYVFRTWHPRTRPADVEPSGLRWTGLTVLREWAGGQDDVTGEVEFVADHLAGRHAGRLHERSRFERRRGRRVYVDGTH